jgi:hypothetical protein
MFQFPSLAYTPYVFRRASWRITTSGFPHSEIPGSLIGQHLPRAYRSRPRPSSPLGAKASTVCPCSLDRKNSGNDVAMEFSRCTRDRARPTQKEPAFRQVSQNSAASSCRRGDTVEVDIILGELNAGRLPVMRTPLQPSTGSVPTDMNCRLP